jgi:hypothetical protein
MRKTWLSALPHALTLLITGALLAGCKDPGGSSGEVYRLDMVNQRPLPTDFPDPLLPQGTYVVTAGELVLEDDRTLSGSFTMACRPDLPAGTPCGVGNNPRRTFKGTYSREDKSVVMGERRYQIQFSERVVTMRIVIPSYEDFYPVYYVRFSR